MRNWTGEIIPSGGVHGSIIVFTPGSEVQSPIWLSMYLLCGQRVWSMQAFGFCITKGWEAEFSLDVIGDKALSSADRLLFRVI